MIQRPLRFAALALLELSVTGCVYAPPRRPRVVYAPAPVVVRPPPPPVIVETPPPPPRPMLFWHPGHWRWDGFHWVWDRGHYAPAR